jgi:hypothetical protein
MNEPTANTYTVDDIHEMRISVAEQYRAMTPDEAEREFRTHVENAKRTMEALRKDKQLATN